MCVRVDEQEAFQKVGQLIDVELASTQVATSVAHAADVVRAREIALQDIALDKKIGMGSR